MSTILYEMLGTLCIYGDIYVYTFFNHYYVNI